MPAPTRLTLAPEIDDFRRQFEALADEADAMVAPISDLQLAWRPSPERWSVGHCIDHLNTTARAYLPELDQGIAAAIRQGMYGEGPFTYWWWARLFVVLQAPPPRFRTRAPTVFQPPLSRTRHEIMSAFRAYQVQYVDRLRQANGLDLSRSKVRSPVASWLYFPLGIGFAATIAHEQRHLWQARQVMREPGFPS